MPRLAFPSPEQNREFSSRFTIPIVEDVRLPLSTTLRPLLTQGSDFSFRFEQVLSAAERHVFIEGEPDNPIDLVEDWITALKWEMDAFWIISSHANTYYPKDKRHGISLTGEHWKRSGEYIAEGIAIAFLEARLGLSRARFAFYSPRDMKPRPDFILTPQPSDRLMVLYPGQASLGVEIRSRSRWNSIHKSDHLDLNDKKTRFGRTNQLSVYCSYGERSGRYAGCRLILGDPPGDGVIFEAEDVRNVAIRSYLDVCRRIGLWSYARVLQARLRGQELNLEPGPDVATGAVRLVSRLAPNGSRYRGREFATFYSDAVNDIEATEERVNIRAQSGDLGTIVFRGVNTDVLDLIESQDWDGLVRFYDPASAEVHEGRTITGDGTYRETSRVTQDSAEAMEIVRFTLAEVRRRRLGSI